MQFSFVSIPDSCYCRISQQNSGMIYDVFTMIWKTLLLVLKYRWLQPSSTVDDAYNFPWQQHTCATYVVSTLCLVSRTYLHTLSIHASCSHNKPFLRYRLKFSYTSKNYCTKFYQPTDFQITPYENLQLSKASLQRAVRNV